MATIISTPSDIAVIFDLDGTLVDSVYQHVEAWHEAMLQCGIVLPLWKIHRKIGMSGGLVAEGLAREIHRSVDASLTSRLLDIHAREYLARLNRVAPTEGANELLGELTRSGVPWAIATSSDYKTACSTLSRLTTQVPVLVTRDEVKRGKPYPDLFIKAAAQLNYALSHCIVIGDASWDHLAAQRGCAFSVGVLSGGYGTSELREAGALRVYADPADILDHLDELALGRAEPADNVVS